MNLLLKLQNIIKIILLQKLTRYNTIKNQKLKNLKVKAKPNKFVRQVTKDMFTGQIIYVYTNLKTGETIKSTDGNKLDELNAKKES